MYDCVLSFDRHTSVASLDSDINDFVTTLWPGSRMTVPSLFVECVVNASTSILHKVTTSEQEEFSRQRTGASSKSPSMGPFWGSVLALEEEDEVLCLQTYRWKRWDEGPSSLRKQRSIGSKHSWALRFYRSYKGYIGIMEKKMEATIGRRTPASPNATIQGVGGLGFDDARRSCTKLCLNKRDYFISGSVETVLQCCLPMARKRT